MTTAHGRATACGCQPFVVSLMIPTTENIVIYSKLVGYKPTCFVSG